MYEDIIFSKIYKNKRYLNKLFEYKSYETNEEEINKYKQKIVMENKQTILNALQNFNKAFSFYNVSPQPSKYYMIENSSHYGVFFSFNKNPSFKITKESFNNNHDIANRKAKSETNNILQRTINYYLQRHNISVNNLNAEIININDKINDSSNRFVFINSIFTGGIIIDKTTYNIDKNYINIYIDVNDDKNSSFDLLNEVIKRGNFNAVSIENILDSLELNSESFDSPKSNKSKNNKEKENKEPISLSKYNVEIADNADEIENPTIHLLSKKKNPGLALPFLYTKEVITDDSARTYLNVCDMVENNVTNIEDKILSKDYDKVFVYNKKNIQNFKNTNADEIKSKQQVLNNDDLIPSAVSLENLAQARSISIRLCETYLNAMKLAKDKIFDKDYEKSKGLNYNLHNYLVEILSPLAISGNPLGCTWMENDPQHGYNKFCEHVGLPSGATDFSNNTFISFPTISNFPLADSILFINGIKTYISTKGGLDGKGSNASIKTLSEFVYGENGTDKSKLITKLENDSNIKHEYPIFLELLKGDVRKLNWNVISKHCECSHINELSEWVRVPEIKAKFTYIIMTVLQAASFQFMQVMAKANSTNENFHFNYTVQYPAVFNGQVQIIIPKTSSDPSKSRNTYGIKFHIEGENEKTFNS